MIAGYKELKAGDIRQERDEKRRPPDDEKGPHSYGEFYQKKYPADFVWHQIDLVGYTILASDLIGFEFRRPLPF